jgi:hypothetical protein
MTRGERPAGRRAGRHAADPLDEALRQIGADMLDEPVPERLLRVLRQAQNKSGSEPEPTAHARQARKPEGR